MLYLWIYCFDFNTPYSGAFVQIDTPISDGVATEGQGLGSLQICVVLTGGTATSTQDDVIVPLNVVADKAGMCNLG